MTDRLKGGERQVRVLLLARERGEITAQDVQRRFDLSASYTYDVLSLLVEKGRLEVSGGGPKPGRGAAPKRHRLTREGEDYLDWYRETNGGLPDIRSGR